MKKRVFRETCFRLRFFDYGINSMFAGKGREEASFGIRHMSKSAFDKTIHVVPPHLHAVCMFLPTQ